MKIAYIAIWDIFSPSGVTNKINSQMRAMSELGYEVEGFFICPNNTNESHISSKHHVEYEGNSKDLLSLFFNRAKAIRKLNKKLIKFQPDYIYYRQSIYFPFLGKILSTAKLFIEINTNELNEYKLIKENYFVNYVKFTRGFALKRAYKIVCVSKEIAEIENQSGYSNTLISGNGINVDEIPFYAQPIPMEESHSGKITLGFAGSPNQPWHGIDKILKLAKLFYEKSNLNLLCIIIGSESYACEQVTPNVRFMGYLDGESLEKAFKSLDIAISTSALHRNGMNEASPLKTRHYLSRGIPTIIPYYDTDCSIINHDFTLNLPNTENNLFDNFNLIHDFIKNSYKNYNIRLQARLFSEISLDYTKKIKQLLSY